jgi:hypothetical protein
MNPTLLIALVALVPTGVLLFGEAVFFSKRKTAGALLQFLGAGCLMVVVLTHVCEGLSWLSWMHWGEKHSAGHYLDLTGAVVSVALLPVGFVLHALRASAR